MCKIKSHFSDTPDVYYCWVCPIVFPLPHIFNRRFGGYIKFYRTWPGQVASLHAAHGAIAKLLREAATARLRRRLALRLFRWNLKQLWANVRVK